MHKHTHTHTSPKTLLPASLWAFGEAECVLLLRNSLPCVSAGGLLLNIIMSPSIGEDDTFFFSANIYLRLHWLSRGPQKRFHWLTAVESRLCCQTPHLFNVNLSKWLHEAAAGVKVRNGSFAFLSRSLMRGNVWLLGYTGLYSYWEPSPENTLLLQNA